MVSPSSGQLRMQPATSALGSPPDPYLPPSPTRTPRDKTAHVPVSWRTLRIACVPLLMHLAIALTAIDDLPASRVFQVTPHERRLLRIRVVPSEVRPALSRPDEGETIHSRSFLNRIQKALPLTVVGTAMAVIGLMHQPQHGGHGGGRGRRSDPPAWAPEREATYPFRDWAQDLLAWSIIATDLDAAQQTASIILQLGGEARNMARHLSYNDLTNGGLIQGNHVDPVTYLLHHLAVNFAPLGEEAQLAAIAELHRFARKPGESRDSLPSRFLTLRYCAAQRKAKEWP